MFPLTDPFDTFQIEPSFTLNEEELGKRHRDLSRALHPDRYAGRPASERRAALGRAIEVNEAYRVLRDPVRRAEALLVRLGEEVGERTEPPADPEFLMTMMERREALRDLGRQQDRARIEALCAETERDRQRLLAALQSSFAAALGAASPEGAMQAGSGTGGKSARSARLALGELRYLRRFFDEADAVLDELG